MKKKNKVLIISSSPMSTTNNNGKTLLSFFKKYGKDYLAHFSFDRCKDIDFKACDNYYIFTINDVLKRKKGFNVQRVVEKDDNSKKTNSYRFFHFFSAKKIPLFTFVKNLIWKRADFSSALLWVKSYGPDIVFFQGFGYSYGYDFCLKICKELKIPFILQLTDDYTKRYFNLSLLDYFNHRAYMKRFKESVALCKRLIVISEDMQIEYKQRFNKNSLILMNGFVGKYPAADRNEKEYFYCGNVMLNRWKVLINFGKALELIGDNSYISIHSHLDIPDRIVKKFNRIKTIRLGDRLNNDELIERLSKCGHVVHVESFDKKNIKVTRLSMSTKISEYINCEADFIAVGPSTISSMKFLQKYNFARCINSNKTMEIYNALIQKKVVSTSKKELFNKIYSIDSIDTVINQLINDNFLAENLDEDTPY